MKKTLYALALLTASVAGQEAPPSTKFLGHIVGETLDHWLVASHMDQAEICGKHDRRDKRMDFKQVCSVLGSVRAGQPGNIFTNADNVQWSFANGKVSAAMMIKSIGFDTTTEGQIAFLTEVYGKPSRYDTVKNSNLAGGTWNTVHVEWDMTDGARIVALEILSTGGMRGLSRQLWISASSRESLANTKQPTNPYK